MTTLSIRPALEDDLRHVFRMGVSFIVSQPNYALIFQWTPGGLEEFIGALAAGETSTVLLLELEDEVGIEPIGMIVLVLVPNPFGGPPWVEEVAYWLEPEARKGRAALYLLGAAEDWARQKGAAVLKMVAPWGSRIGTLYERRGYEPLETSYFLRL